MQFPALKSEIERLMQFGTKTRRVLINMPIESVNACFRIDELSKVKIWRPLSEEQVTGGPKYQIDFIQEGLSDDGKPYHLGQMYLVNFKYNEVVKYLPSVVFKDKETKQREASLTYEEAEKEAEKIVNRNMGSAEWPDSLTTDQLQDLIKRLSSLQPEQLISADEFYTHPRELD